MSIRPGYKARALFDDKVEVEADLGGLVAESPRFAPSRDPALFAVARLVNRGVGIEWPGGIDYSAGALRRLAEVQACEARAGG